MLVRPGTEDRLGVLGQRVRWWAADVWDTASLRGRARGHQLVIHTVGSLRADPSRGLTYHRLNFVSARNVVTMCVSDGVQHMILMSAVRAPWINRQYIRTKREAEQYLARVGVQGTIIRAPIAYIPGAERPLFYSLMTGLGSVPPLSWTHLGRMAPMPVDLLARGVARIALDNQRTKSIYYAPDLRKRSRQDDLPFFQEPPIDPGDTPRAGTRRVPQFDILDEDSPFGWTPPKD